MSLQPGQKTTIFETKQAGRIIGFELSSTGNLEKIARDIDLKITWDDETSLPYIARWLIILVMHLANLL